MTETTTSLPHDGYLHAVHDALAALGIEPDRSWTETPDGQQLDAVAELRTNPAIRAEWDGGVFLGWDQRAGWSLVDEGTNRTLYPLGLDVYANPKAVAQRAYTILFGAGSNPVDEVWGGAEALQAAVEAWATAPRSGHPQREQDSRRRFRWHKRAQDSLQTGARVHVGEHHLAR